MRDAAIGHVDRAISAIENEQASELSSSYNGEALLFLRGARDCLARLAADRDQKSATEEGTG